MQLAEFANPIVEIVSIHARLISRAMRSIQRMHRSAYEFQSTPG